MGLLSFLRLGRGRNDFTQFETKTLDMRSIPTAAYWVVSRAGSTSGRTTRT